ncbi:hypothetical protein MZO42_13590 [Sphingomonas psychrotolerans]|uniref:Glycosyl transferase family 11 n=1 Tax=Sphingomonas psychrotolerans TaxID=1327635 RepID=A0ABU3N5C5_9SPHN|nr:hypothetical protein [Sphingomonas psychrotolerans]MDT8759730.1 hypothetical protein [Sphingomonas psychrotolerans]
MSGPRVYAMPVLGRYGLTHGLLAWARCRLWCEQNGAAMVAPFWLKLRVGPYLRRERDKRNYFLLFHSGRAIAGLRRLLVLGRARKIEIGTEWPAPVAEDGPVLLRFHNALKDNEKKSFAQVVGHGAFLRRELLAITRRRYHPQPRTEPFIAIHVRLGDFAAPPPGAAVTAAATNTRLPIDWYGDRLDALRAALGRPVAAIVFSDGSDADLAPLLSRSHVSRAPKQQSVTDLLSMGEGVALIASGSGFSLWGAFLGSAPRIAHPGQSIVPVDADATRDIESPAGSELPVSFVGHVRARLMDR